jgi:hypothetical protein
VFVDQLVLLLITVLIFNVFSIRLEKFIKIITRVSIPALTIIFYLLNYSEIKNSLVLLSVGFTYFTLNVISRSQNILDERKTFVTYLFLLFYILPDERIETSFLKVFMLYVVDIMMAKSHDRFNVLKILLGFIVMIVSLTVKSPDFAFILQFCFILILILDAIFDLNSGTMCFSGGIKIIIGYMLLASYWELIEWSTIKVLFNLLHVIAWVIFLSLIVKQKDNAHRIIIVASVLVFINQTIMLDKSFIWVFVLCASYVLAYSINKLGNTIYNIIILLLIIFSAYNLNSGYFSQITTATGTIIMALICLAPAKNKII